MTNVTNMPNFRCPQCEAVSFNPNDIEYRYCGSCNVFWDDLEKLPSRDQCARVGHKWSALARNVGEDGRPMEAKVCHRCGLFRALQFMSPEVRAGMLRRRRRAMAVLLLITLASTVFQVGYVGAAMKSGDRSQMLWSWGLAVFSTVFMLLIARMLWVSQTFLMDTPIYGFEAVPVEGDDDLRGDDR